MSSAGPFWKIVAADIHIASGQETVAEIKKSGREAVFVQVDVAVAVRWTST
jgi:hypothetical protein